jgi:hypothetical protein
LIYGRRVAAEPVTVRDVVGRLVVWLERLMPAGERRDALVAELTGRFRSDESPLTASGCAAVERAAWPIARHVALIHEPDATAPPTAADPRWLAACPRRRRRHR